MKYKVFQIMLTNEAYKEINAKGWGNTDWDNDYFYLTNGFTKTKDTTQLLARMRDLGFVKHTRTIEANTLEEVYEAGNGFGTYYQEIHAPAKSISVGDVIHNTTENTWHVVAPIGFEELGVSLNDL